MRLIIKKYKVMQIQKLKLTLNKEIIKIRENRILKVNLVWQARIKIVNKHRIIRYVRAICKIRIVNFIYGTFLFIKMIIKLLILGLIWRKSLFLANLKKLSDSKLINFYKIKWETKKLNK